MISASIVLGSTIEIKTAPASATSPGSTLRAETIPLTLAFKLVRCKVDCELFN